jgi:hypothetical protein
MAVREGWEAVEMDGGSAAAAPTATATAAGRKYTPIPVLANGGIFSLADVYKCMETTGVDGSCLIIVIIPLVSLTISLGALFTQCTLQLRSTHKVS